VKVSKRLEVSRSSRPNTVKDNEAKSNYIMLFRRNSVLFLSLFNNAFSTK
jgi:hypothetical protein